MSVKTMPHAAVDDHIVDAVDDHIVDTPLSVAVANHDATVLDIVERALAEGHTKLAFQPIVLASDTTRVAFYEGLIRVLDDSDRVIPASHFMPKIEETGLGRRIDGVTLDLAFRKLRADKDLRLSINVSARSFADSNWRRTLESGLAEYGSLGERLIFEISESSAMDLHEVVAGFMREMQPRGVCFALDSFGGGMISFRHLKEFYFDLVKIDKSFVRGIANRPDDQVLVEALMTVARQFEMLAVVEGVETAEDAAFLMGIGVDCMQGWLFGRPMFDIP